MIKAGIVAMAVIGCDCDAKMCEYIRTTGTEWTSVAACEADLKARIVTQHEDYPLVIAVCREISDSPIMANSPMSRPELAPSMQVQLLTAPVVADGSKGEVSTDGLGRVTTVFKTINGYVSVRDTVGGVWSSASRRALETASWLRSAVTPEWF